MPTSTKEGMGKTGRDVPSEHLDDSHLLGGVARETTQTNDVMLFAGDVPS